MLQTEYTRNLNCNYERIILDKKPEESRYQYCILSRGGIKGLLPCSLRYIDDKAYLYYNISSTQNIAQLYGGRNVDRTWLKDFLWSMKFAQREMGRFLLDDRNLIFYPAQIYQDLEENDFLFQYIPYYEGDCGFGLLLDFLVDHVDYEDENLVEFIYKAHGQYEVAGISYIQGQIFEDAKVLELPVLSKRTMGIERKTESEVKENINPDENNELKEDNVRKEVNPFKKEVFQPNGEADKKEDKKGEISGAKQEKRGLIQLLEGRKKKQKAERASYQRSIQEQLKGFQTVSEEAVYQGSKQGEKQYFEENIESSVGHVQCENIKKDYTNTEYQEEAYGRTMYVNTEAELEEKEHRLFQGDGKQIAKMSKSPFLIGKKKEEVDCVLNDSTISRIHARIILEERGVFIEDLNSTNGTFKNGLRMQPYEKRKLEVEDEIKLGRVV
ncbi:DUF6382 domain-containing protein, partial [Lachnospiraceae bacterium OttesenSCG-928-D06]|nr:DUF6382 domain-containing protein [Lachnospiraceae bacterium OttesenSCG-928-D06]